MKSSSKLPKRKQLKLNNQDTLNLFIEKYEEQRKSICAPSTHIAEKSKASKLKKLFRRRAIQDINHSDIHDAIGKLHKRYKNKTINEFLTILRAVFSRAQRDGLITLNPMDGIENLKVVNAEPMPFEKEEIQKLFNTPTECQSGKHALLFNILTGVRIGELLALSWEDIDWSRRVLYVRRSKVLNDYKVPKTPGSVREVELNELALNVLRDQLPLTEKKRARTISVLQMDNKTLIKERVHFIFYNSQTSQPFLNAKQFNKTFFTPFLKKAGVKHRGSSQLRHTYASQNLTAGISKDWLASQMGHTNTHMIDKHYGRWMRKDAPDYANAAANHLADVLGCVNTTPTKTTVKRSDTSPEMIALLQTLIHDKPELKAALLQGNMGSAS
ncbi:site-specific integrase [Vibrio sp. 03-59-1]|uniref:tyrosine-type recombinase/integrase n=1 Tax=Vibrio sp. 03-59-1 TaxID=2607607 RepID=UPI0014937AA4|nr:site-specific integrase [Vibrio sp. 03-59-1]NOH82548.1 site-specific integrase [Vibrio sp. 03-59-1]